MDDGHALGDVAPTDDGLRPTPKAGQVGRDRRDAKGHALERRVAPRLVVGGVERGVHTDEEVVVRRVEDPVAAVEVAGYEDDLQALAVDGVEAGVEDEVRDAVVVHAVQPVGEEGGGQRCSRGSAVLKDSLQVGTRGIDPGRDEHEGDDRAGQVGRCAQAVHGVDKDVDALVAILVAAADGDEERVVRVERLAVER